MIDKLDIASILAKRYGVYDSAKVLEGNENDYIKTVSKSYGLLNCPVLQPTDTYQLPPL